MTKFTETLHVGYAQTYEMTRVYFEDKTDHQHLVIFENPIFGRVMALDGVIQTTERDEFIYHEMFVHIPLLQHHSPRHVLIIGGGDGGVLREVCRYRGVKSITMVEIDEAVVELAQQYLPKHSSGSFSDPRLNLVISDGLRFIQNCQQKFDVILSDSTDPVGPGEALFQKPFYANCRRCLTDNGILVTQNGVSFLQLEELVTTQQRMQPYMQKVDFYSASVPTYIGGNMHYAWGQAGNDELAPYMEIERRYRHNNLANVTRYFHPKMHHAAFVLPKYVIEALNKF